MNIKIHRILLSVAILGVLIGYSKAQQKKNILHVHFQVRHLTDSMLKADAGSESFSVTYRVECNRPPCKFHGFQLNLVFDQIRLSPNGGNAAYFDGSASVNAAIHQSSYTPATGTFSVFVDEPLPGMLDTANHLLFRYLTSVKLSDGDSALIEPALFDVLRSNDSNVNSNIDTVIIDNAAGRFSDGTWYPFPVAYLDYTPGVKKYPITLASDSAGLKSDSSKIVTFFVQNADSANVKNAVVSMIFDTSAIEIKNVLRGPMLSSATLNSNIAGDTLRVTISSTTPLQGNDTAFFVAIHAKTRHDTLCEAFTTPLMTVSNADNAVSQIQYDLHPVCIFGVKQDTVSRSVEANPKTSDFIIELLSDGRTLSVRSANGSDLGSKILRVYSENGALVMESPLYQEQMQFAVTLSSGTYVAVISDAAGVPISRKKFSVIH